MTTDFHLSPPSSYNNIAQNSSLDVACITGVYLAASEVSVDIRNNMHNLVGANLLHLRFSGVCWSRDQPMQAFLSPPLPSQFQSENALGTRLHLLTTSRLQERSCQALRRIFFFFFFFGNLFQGHKLQTYFRYD